MEKDSKILIVSLEIDPHADAVKWGLQKLGYGCTIWNQGDFPLKTSASVSASITGEITCELQLDGSSICGPFDVIWVRRPINPTPKKDCHNDDIEIVERESKQFLANLLPHLGHEKTLWINHPDKEKLAECKLRQLLLAQKAGFKIPATYMGNSPDEIRKFYAINEGQVVYKGFRRGTWNNIDQSMTILRTSRLSAAHIADDYAISACPGIYQKLIEKQYELRVTVLGSDVYAAKIDSQKDGTTIDWRYDFKPGKEPIGDVVIPDSLSAKCRSICKQLSLSYAAFDIIFDRNGEYVFLELNSSGQFLFVEYHIPTMLLLDKFCRFLLVGKISMEKSALHLADYYESISYRTLLQREKEHELEHSKKMLQA